MGPKDSKKGRSAMKRIRVNCGVCKLTKFYSIHRGITRIATIVACEACRHFYQKLKRSPTSMDCLQEPKGKCFRNGTFVEERCKACWTMQIMDSCPHPLQDYNVLSDMLSEDCQKCIRGLPLLADEVPTSGHGELFLEVLQENLEWKDVSSTENVEEYVAHLDKEADNATGDTQKKNYEDYDDDDDDDDDEDEDIDVDVDVDIMTDQMAHADDATDASPELSCSGPSSSHQSIENRMAMLLQKQPKARAVSRKRTSGIDLSERHEEDVDDLSTITSDIMNDPANYQNQIRVSNRTQRKKKVQYFGQSNNRQRSKGLCHGPDGRINGKDLCDCLQIMCDGCHFPCAKCRSPKCGVECRVNRRWYFEKVEVEGTNIVRHNMYAPSNF